GKAARGPINMLVVPDDGVAHTRPASAATSSAANEAVDSRAMFIGTSWMALRMAQRSAQARAPTICAPSAGHKRQGTSERVGGGLPPIAAHCRAYRAPGRIPSAATARGAVHTGK